MSETSAIHDALSKVNDPELHRSITELGMVESINQIGDTVNLRILLTISGCPMRDRLTADIEKAVLEVPGVKKVVIDFGVMNEEQRANIKKLLKDSVEQWASISNRIRALWLKHLHRNYFDAVGFKGNKHLINGSWALSHQSHQARNRVPIDIGIEDSNAKPFLGRGNGEVGGK